MCAFFESERTFGNDLRMFVGSFNKKRVVFIRVILDIEFSAFTLKQAIQTNMRLNLHYSSFAGINPKLQSQWKCSRQRRNKKPQNLVLFSFSSLHTQTDSRQRGKRRNIFFSFISFLSSLRSDRLDDDEGRAGKLRGI